MAKTPEQKAQEERDEEAFYENYWRDPRAKAALETAKRIQAFLDAIEEQKKTLFGKKELFEDYDYYDC